MTVEILKLLKRPNLTTVVILKIPNLTTVVIFKIPNLTTVVILKIPNLTIHVFLFIISYYISYYNEVIPVLHFLTYWNFIVRTLYGIFFFYLDLFMENGRIINDFCYSFWNIRNQIALVCQLKKTSFATLDW